jgi:uncharacterized OB-fold protein
MDKKEVTLNEAVGVEMVHFPSSPEDKPSLIGSRCKLCKRVYFPKTEVCPVCLKEDTTEEVLIGQRGKIWSWSFNGSAPAGFKPPYLTAFVDSSEGARVYSLITGVEPKIDALEIGEEVGLVIEKIKETEAGQPIIGFKYRPIKGEK